MLNKIIEAADVTKEDLVIEIGPGIGGLTQPLAQRCGKVIAIEIDKNLIPILNDTLSEYENIEIINADVLKLDLLKVIEESGYKSVKVVANLPYYITTPIVMEFLEKKYPVESLTVMVQKEVALRMKASPKTKEYGALSLAVQYYSVPYIVANVPQNCFIPRPNVDSTVIKLKVTNKHFKCTKNEQLMFKVIKAAFSMRRKTLVNCLFDSGFPNMDKQNILKLIAECGLDENIRGEALSLEQFGLIADCLAKKL